MLIYKQISLSATKNQTPIKQDLKHNTMENSLKSNRYLGINLTKNEKNFHKKNYKMLPI